MKLIKFSTRGLAVIELPVTEVKQGDLLFQNVVDKWSDTHSLIAKRSFVRCDGVQIACLPLDENVEVERYIETVTIPNLVLPAQVAAFIAYHWNATFKDDNLNTQALALLGQACRDLRET